ncbi:CBS domain-containing protein [Thermoactinomyces sp. AMNI-1]|uniref:CBS domain-containing protein n=1 Tax=Thermoactinomyces mirandus TaxID=2756294 RepID=A0A7W2AS71_9BACL|nr:CBS domain-containing protein [Thermoactinomyces mirandus]
MTQKVYQIPEQASLANAAEKMNHHGVSYLLVCHGQTPIGVIGYSDIIHAYREK